MFLPRKNIKNRYYEYSLRYLIFHVPWRLFVGFVFFKVQTRHSVDTFYIQSQRSGSLNLSLTTVVIHCRGIYDSTDAASDARQCRERN